MLSSLVLFLAILGVLRAQSIYFGWAQRPDPLPREWYGLSNPEAGNSIYGFSAQMSSVRTGPLQGAMISMVGAPLRANGTSTRTTGYLTIMHNCFAYTDILEESNDRCSDSMDLEEKWYTMAEPEVQPYGDPFDILGETPDLSRINYFMGWTVAIQFVEEGALGAVACGFGRWGLTAEGRILCYHNSFTAGARWTLLNMTSGTGTRMYMDPANFAFNISGAPQGLRLGESMSIDPESGSLAVGVSRYLNKHGRVYVYPPRNGVLAQGYTGLAAEGAIMITPESAGVAADLAALGFGYSVAWGPSELYIGCPGRDLQQGSVFVFSKSGAFLTEVKADDAAGGMQFGISLDAAFDSDHHFIVGANRLDLSSSTGKKFAAGNAYVFALVSGQNETWELQANLRSNICDDDICLVDGGDQMGRKVSISADALYAVASAHNDNGLNPTDTRTGTIFVFNRDFSADQNPPVLYALVSTRRNGDEEQGSVFSRALSIAVMPNELATDFNYYILAGAPGSNLLDPAREETTGMAYLFQGVTQRIDTGTTGDSSSGGGSSSGGENSSPAATVESVLF